MLAMQTAVIATDWLFDCQSRSGVLSRWMKIRYKMLLLDSFTALDVPSTLQTLWSAFTGYAYKNGSSLKLLFWHSEQYTALHHLICRRSSLVSLMWPHVAGWDRRLPTNSLCRHTACLQSEPGPSRSPVPTSGTVCRRMWPPLHQCRCSDNAWRQFCSAAAIRTYVSSELCLPSLTVVLVVFFKLRPL